MTDMKIERADKPVELSDEETEQAAGGAGGVYVAAGDLNGVTSGSTSARKAGEGQKDF